MLDKRRRRWSSIVQMLYKCFVLTTWVVFSMRMHFIWNLFPPFRASEHLLDLRIWTRLECGTVHIQTYIPH